MRGWAGWMAAAGLGSGACGWTGFTACLPLPVPPPTHLPACLSPPRLPDRREWTWACAAWRSRAPKPCSPASTRPRRDSPLRSRPARPAAAQVRRRHRQEEPTSSRTLLVWRRRACRRCPCHSSLPTRWAPAAWVRRGGAGWWGAQGAAAARSSAAALQVQAGCPTHPPWALQAPTPRPLCWTRAASAGRRRGSTAWMARASPPPRASTR